MKFLSFSLVFSSFIVASNFCVSIKDVNTKNSINNICCNKSNSNVGAPFVPIDYASVSDYGPSPHNPSLFRDARFSIFMTPPAYNVFLISIMDITDHKEFADLFAGTRAPYFLGDWRTTQGYMRTSLGEASDKRKGIEHTTYFYDMFLNWLNSEQGFSCFKNVYTGNDLSHNTYAMPTGYNRQQAEFDFRTQGVVLQLGFVPSNLSQSTWKILDSSVRICPQNAKTVALKYYYTDTVSKGGKYVSAPPVFDIRLEEPPTHELTVSSLLLKITAALKYNFDVQSSIWSKKLVRVPDYEMDKRVSYKSQTPTSIYIAFYSYTNPPEFYIDKAIRIYTS